MGAAYSEGMIAAFMKHKELKKLLENGQIIHFAAADADEIIISENSKHLMRSQLNYLHDQTINNRADIGQKKGGYRIKGVKKIGIVTNTEGELHKGKTKKNYDLHFDTKTYKQSWEFLKALDFTSELQNSNFNAIKLDKKDLYKTYKPK